MNLIKILFLNYFKLDYRFLVLELYLGSYIYFWRYILYIVVFFFYNLGISNNMDVRFLKIGIK